MRLGVQDMNEPSKNDEIRWRVVKAMIDEFPALRERVRNYVEKRDRGVG